MSLKFKIKQFGEYSYLFYLSNLLNYEKKQSLKFFF